MLTIILGLVVFLLLAQLGFIAYLYLRTKNEIANYLISFFSSPGSDKPSEFAMVFEQLASVLATKIIMSAEAAIRGMSGGIASGESRGEMAALKESNPLMGMLMSQRGLRKQPMLNLIVTALGQHFISKQQAGVPSNGRAERPKFEL